MTILMYLVGLVGALALVAELIMMVGRDFLSGGQQTEALKESIRKTQSELRAADKKLDALRTTRRGALKELEATASKLEELDKTARRPPDAPPVLVYTVGLPGAFGRRFRAPVTKTLPGDADENQTQLWKHQSFIEIISDDADSARSEALRQFSEAGGYVVSPFVETHETTESAA